MNGRESLYNIEIVAGSALGMKRSKETRMKIGSGRKGKLHSEEAKAYYRIIRKGTRPPEKVFEKSRLACKGRIVSEEQKRKTSEALMGRKHTEETIAKIKAATKGKKREKPFTKEHRQKLSEARKSYIAKIKLASEIYPLSWIVNKFHPVPGWE
jgi:hypothetical protein